MNDPFRSDEGRLSGDVVDFLVAALLRPTLLGSSFLFDGVVRAGLAGAAVSR